MSPDPGLAAAVDRLAGARVLCVGDVMLDRFVYGRVDRISPEAPIPVLRIDRERAMLGGAGNVLRNLVSLGAAVEFVSVVGKDSAGHEVMRLVGDLDKVEPHLLVDAARPTTIKTRYIAEGHQMLRADLETGAPVGAETGRDVVRLVEQSVADCDVLVLSDYGKGALQNHQELIRIARARGIPVLADPKGKDFSIYRGASLITPNLSEFEAIVGRCADEAELVAKGEKPIPPGPGNPLGTRWMGLSAAAVGIHGTPDAASIGYSASHGCIRMRVPDAEWLFEHVDIGTPVVIV